MKYLNWILRALFFIIVLSFAVKNDQPVVLSYFLGFEWQTSLVLVLLIFFAAGTVVGILALMMTLLRQRHELATLRKELRLKNKSD